MSAITKADIVQFFCRHLVSLFIVYRHKDDPDEAGKPPRFLASSGTLIAIQNHVFYLTAGHVLQGIEKRLLRNRDVEIPAVRLVDSFGLGAPSHLSIPFDLAGTPLFYIDDEADGLDFGVIHIRPYYVHLLAKGGVIALDEQR